MASFNTPGGSAMRPQSVIHDSNWQSGFCGCCADTPVCLLGWCCPCILFGKIAHEIDGSTSCVAASLIWCVLEQFCFGCGCLYSCGYRKKLRGLHGIPEDCCPDCLLHYCCPGCAFCQEYREIKARSTTQKKAPSASGIEFGTAPPQPQSMKSY